MQNKNSLSEIIQSTGIRKAHLAFLMNMPTGTFNNKLNTKQIAYHFTAQEEKQLKMILHNIAKTILNYTK